jgi:hypothetical protein
MMHPENGDWILVQGSDPKTLRGAIVEHSELAGHEEPITLRVSVFRVDAEWYGVRFDPKAPPYAFTNLIGWLDDPRMTPGAVRAAGWYTSPGSGVRYALAPSRPNAGGDSLVGRADDGALVGVYLPECRLYRLRVGPELPAEPPLGQADPLVQFDIEADADLSFGNPLFVGDRMVLYDYTGKRIATPDDIEQAIRGLDGEWLTEAMFTDEAGKIILHVAGGGANYLLSLTWPDRVLNLAGPDADGWVSLVAAGQRVEVPRSQVAGLDTALQAARYFARTGEPNPSLEWYQT